MMMMMMMIIIIIIGKGRSFFVSESYGANETLGLYMYNYSTVLLRDTLPATH